MTGAALEYLSGKTKTESKTSCNMSLSEVEEYNSFIILWCCLFAFAFQFTFGNYFSVTHLFIDLHDIAFLLRYIESFCMLYLRLPGIEFFCCDHCVCIKQTVASLLVLSGF